MLITSDVSLVRRRCRSSSNWVFLLAVGAVQGRVPGRPDERVETSQRGEGEDGAPDPIGRLARGCEALPAG